MLNLPGGHSPRRRAGRGRPFVAFLALAAVVVAACGPSEPAAVSDPTVAPSAPTSGSVLGTRPPTSALAPPPPPNPPVDTTSSSMDTAPPPAPPAGVFACVDRYARSLTLRGKIGQLLMANVAPSGAATQDLVTRYGVGGVVVATGRDGVLQQVDMAGVATPDGLPVFVSVDEEGGRVQRLRSLPKLPSARQMAATQSPEQVQQVAIDHGRKMRALGINMDFAPVVDVSDQPASSVIGDRAFSNDPATVIDYAGSFADGLRQAGVLPVFKHFPGHGQASGDTHKTAATTPPLAQLRTRDLVPYQELLETGPAGVMIGHLDVPGLTATGEPTSISPATIDGLLRQELGFDGLVMTDELGGMQAIAGRVSLPEAARRTLVAGSDVVLWSDETQVGAVLDHLEASVRNGSLPESRVDEALRRVLLTKVYLKLIC